MNGFISTKRISWLAGAVALVAMALPTQAMAGKAHVLKLYKVEKHVDLQGQDETYNVKCYGTDLALDGMWRIDDVEQDNDYVFPNTPSLTTGNAQFDVLRSVRPIEVRNNGDSSYDFRFTPESGGDVQTKLMITCLGRNAEVIAGHTHSWAITAGGSDPVDNNPVADLTAAGSCPSGIVVQPGFVVLTGDADLLTSRPANPADTAWQWIWDFAQGAPGDFTATNSWNCLVLKSSTVSTHAHRIVKQFRSNDPLAPYSSSLNSSPATVKKKSVSEVQLHCGDHYKGMIGGWHIGAGNPGYTFLWYLGMDPRIKSRAFRFINSSLVNAYRADLYLVCFKDKTT